MPLPVQADVWDTLSSHHGRIRAIVERAWEKWRSVTFFRLESNLDPIMYPRTVANYVFDAIARNAIDEFANDASVHIKIEAQTVKFFFKGGVLGRFKKGDDHRLGRNVATQAVLAFVDPDYGFPDMPPETAKIEFIWLTNELHTRLEQVLVVARDNARLLWAYEIKASEGEIIPFPPQPLDPNDDDDDLVRPKLPDGSKKEAE